jgi:hypothetical protein
LARVSNFTGLKVICISLYINEFNKIIFRI